MVSGFSGVAALQQNLNNNRNVNNGHSAARHEKMISKL
jgi:hypothetical protein